MEFKIDDWDDGKFIVDFRTSLKVGTSLTLSKKEIQKAIIHRTGCDVDNSEKCFQKMIKKGLELCTINLPIEGVQYNLTEYGIIRRYLNPEKETSL